MSARANGIVTKTNEYDADGSWRYEYNEHRDIYRLDIRISEYVDADVIRRHFETLGSRSGFWRDDKIFIHVAEMNDLTKDEEIPVYVFALGDMEKFEAAIRPGTIENAELYKSFLDIPTSELIDTVKNVIESSKDIIYGETINANFERVQLPSIFIAHASADKFFVRKLAEQLRDNKIDVWIDEAEIKVGDSITQKIGKAIEETDFFCILLSHDSVKSEWVKKELEIALQKEVQEKRVVVYPILIDKIELPPFLSNKAYADFTSPEKFDNNLKKLIDSIHSRDKKHVEPKPVFAPSRSKIITVTVHEPARDARTQLVHFEDIHIKEFDYERSYKPDPSKDLYNIYLKLSAVPPNEWVKIFDTERRFPRHPKWREAWIEEKYIIIYCLPEELEKVHDKDLREDVDNTNYKYRTLLTDRAQEEALKERKEEKELTRLKDIKDKLKFNRRAHS